MDLIDNLWDVQKGEVVSGLHWELTSYGTSHYSLGHIEELHYALLMRDDIVRVVVMQCLFTVGMIALKLSLGVDVV